MKAENIMLDHVSWMEDQNYAPGYIAGMIRTVKAWLDYNHIEIRRKIKITNADVQVSIRMKGYLKESNCNRFSMLHLHDADNHKHDCICRNQAAGHGTC